MMPLLQNIKSKYVNFKHNNRLISDYPFDKLHLWPNFYITFLVKSIKLKVNYKLLNQLSKITQHIE